MQDLIYKACWLLCLAVLLLQSSGVFISLGHVEEHTFYVKNHNFTFVFARIWCLGTFLFILCVESINITGYSGKCFTIKKGKLVLVLIFISI